MQLESETAHMREPSMALYEYQVLSAFLHAVRSCSCGALCQERNAVSLYIYFQPLFLLCYKSAHS